MGGRLRGTFALTVEYRRGIAARGCSILQEELQYPIKKEKEERVEKKEESEKGPSRGGKSRERLGKARKKVKRPA